MKKGTLLGAFLLSWQTFCLLGFGGVHKRLDLKDGLSGIGVGVDGDRLGLVVLLAFGIEFDFNFAACTRSDGLFWALRYSATA